MTTTIPKPRTKLAERYYGAVMGDIYDVLASATFGGEEPLEVVVANGSIDSAIFEISRRSFERAIIIMRSIEEAPTPRKIRALMEASYAPVIAINELNRWLALNTLSFKFEPSASLASSINLTFGATLGSMITKLQKRMLERLTSRKGKDVALIFQMAIHEDSYLFSCDARRVRYAKRCPRSYAANYDILGRHISLTYGREANQRTVVSHSYEDRAIGVFRLGAHKVLDFMLPYDSSANTGCIETNVHPSLMRVPSSVMLPCIWGDGSIASRGAYSDGVFGKSSYARNTLEYAEITRAYGADSSESAAKLWRSSSSMSFVIPGKDIETNSFGRLGDVNLGCFGDAFSDEERSSDCDGLARPGLISMEGRW